MANPNFDGLYSTNNVWRDQDETRCLTDDLDAIEADIQELQNASPATYTHPDTHPASMITGLAAVATTGAYADLTGKPTIPAAYTHPGSHPASMITGLSEVATTGSYEDLTDKPTIPAAYSHPANHPASMITGLSEVATSGSYNDLADKPAIPAAYSHPASHPASMITGLATVATTGSYNDLADKPTIPTIPSSLPANGGNADTVDGKNASDFAAANHTHDYAAGNHTHTAAALIAMAEALFGTNANGGSEYSYTSGDVLSAISAYGPGFHTVYAAAGCSTNPDSSESYRYFIHKTGATIGWILAWGSEGSLYTNYQYGDNQFKGWRCLYDASPAPLWSGGANGGYFMTAGHTITPTKKMSECRNGWLLLWSDYDTGANAQANNTDFCVTLIPKRAYAGQVWNGAMWYCDVAAYAAGTATDSETRVIKVLQIYDNKIIGTENNAAAPRNDVVLRAVYEW